MIRKMVNKLISISDEWVLITIVGVILFFTIDQYQQHKNRKLNELDCYAELNKEISGVITKAFFDENPNNKGFVIKFTNGTEYQPKYLTKWQPLTLNEGDSIYKKQGMFRFIIYKKGEAPIIIEDTNKCDNLKK